METQKDWTQKIASTAHLGIPIQKAAWLKRTKVSGKTSGSLIVWFDRAEQVDLAISKATKCMATTPIPASYPLNAADVLGIITPEAVQENRTQGDATAAENTNHGTKSIPSGLLPERKQRRAGSTFRDNIRYKRVE
ncbi:hypothetical protein K3495_g6391 [Podosphaera aphanis]|nr:hypothetical protein K3495_g6391 [Podosphaera aphanis]